MEQHLKLIAIVPPEPVFSEIRKEQEYIAATWGPKHALRTPPHITVIPPISLTSGQVGWLFGMAYALASSRRPFQVDLNDYGSFKPRVVFIYPEVNRQLHELHDLWHEALLLKMPHVFDKYPERPFHPHLTLAHKDVTHHQFDQMYRHYITRRYRASFDVDHFCILKYNGEGWEVEQKYFFDDNNEE